MRHAAARPTTLRILLLLALAAVALAAPAGAHAAGLTVTLTKSPAVAIDTRATQFRWTVRQGKSIVKAVVACKVDGKALATCASPLTVRVKSDGRHTFSVVATRGKRTGSESDSWTVDTVDPVAPTLSGTRDSWTSGSVTITARGGGAGVVRYESDVSDDAGATWRTRAVGATRTLALPGIVRVRFHAVDAAGNAGPFATSDVRIDRTPPTIPVVTGGSTTWQAAGSIVVFASGSTDAGVGGVSYEYRALNPGAADWSAPVAGTAAVITAEGTTRVQFRAIDALGQASDWSPADAAGATTKIDRTDPTVPTVAGGSLAWRNVSDTTITAADSTDTLSGGVTYQHRESTNAGATWSAAAAGASTTVGAEGETIVQSRAIDAAGNVSEWAPSVVGASNTVRIDRTSPTVPTVAGGSVAWQNVAAVTVTGSGATDALSAVSYERQLSVDGGSTWGAPAVGATATVTAEGETLVQIRSKDSAGNVSAWAPAAAGAASTVRIDRTSPTAPTLSGGSLTWQNLASVDVTGAGSTDSFSGVTYEHRVNGGATAVGATATVTAEGESTVQVRSKDAAGNVSAWAPIADGASNTVRLDRSNPTAPTVAGGSLAWQSVASVDVTGSASTDTYSAVSYEHRVNGGATGAGATATVSAQGESTVQVRSKDAAGNVSAWMPITDGTSNTVRIDRTVPTDPTTVAGGSLAWQNVSSVDITGSGSTDALTTVSYEHRSSTDNGGTWSGAAAGDTATVTAEGETLVQVRGKDSAGNVSDWVPGTSSAGSTVRIDRGNPTAPTVAGGSLAWQSVASVDVTGSASTDTYSAVSYEHRVNGGAAVAGATATVSDEGESTVQVRSKDAAGNVSAWMPIADGSSNTVRIDRGNPTAPTVAGGSLAWQSVASVDVTGSASTDTYSAVSYEHRVNGGATVAGATGTVSDEGESTVQVRSKDAAGNVSAWMPIADGPSNTVRIDRGNPTAPTVAGGSLAWQSVASVDVTGSASTDTYSAVSYEHRVNGGAAVAGATATVSAEGESTVQVRSKDAAGNVSAWMPIADGSSNTVRIDRGNPTAPTVAGGSLAWQSVASVDVTGSASTDTYSAVSYEHRVNGGATVAGATATVSAEGESTVQVRSKDAAGNVSAWTPIADGSSNTVRIDRGNPTAPTVTGGSLTWQDVPSLTITGAGSTDTYTTVSYEYRTSDDGTTWTGATAGASALLSGEGEHFAQLRSKDQAGNLSAWTPAANGATNTARIDNSDPTVPTVSGGSTAWSRSAVLISATGSTDGGRSGVLTYQHTVSTDGGGTWSPAADGATFNATLEGTTLVRFRAVDNVGRASAYSTVTAASTANLDLTNPVAPVVSGGSLSWANSISRTIFATGSTDAGGSSFVGYEYRESIDAGATWSTTPVVGASDIVSREGETLVQFRALDGAGNASPWTPAVSDATNTVRLDRSVPSDPLVSGGSLSYGNAASVDVTASTSTDQYNNPITYEYRTSVDSGASWTAAQAGATANVSAEGQTLVQFHATDAVGNTSAWMPTTPTSGSTVRLDRIAPTTPTVSGGSTTWFNTSQIDVTASGSTDLHGPVTYRSQSSTDGGTSWNAPVAGATAPITAEGETLVQFAAVDSVGNVSTYVPAANTAAATVRIDRSAPVAPAVTGGDGVWHDQAGTTVTASVGSDAVSSVVGYEYQTSTNGSAWSAPTAGPSVNVTAEGETLVQFRSIDAANNPSLWAPTAGTGGTVRLDRTNPNAPVVAGGSATWRRTAPVNITASTGGDGTGSGVASYEWSTTGGAPWTAGATAAISAEGTTTVTFRAIDGVGRASGTATANVNLDTIAPTAPTALDGTTAWQKTNRTVTATGGSGTGSNLSYRYETSDDDGVTWTGAAGTASAVLFNTDGKHRVRFFSVDEAGNESAPFTGVGAGDNAAYIDNAAPTLPTVSGGGSTWSNATVTISASGSTDALSGGVTYEWRASTDGGATWALTGTGTNASFVTDGDYLVQFRALDALSNASAWEPSAGVQARVDTTDPSIPTGVTGGNLTWDKNRSTVTFVASGSTDLGGGPVTYEYELTTDLGSATVSATGVVTTEGETTARARSKDRAGNVSVWFTDLTAANVTGRIDTVAPSLPTVSGGSLAWQNTCSRPITGGGSSDTTALVTTSGLDHYESEASLDGGAFGSSASGAVRTVTAEGTTIVHFRAVDLAGNASSFTANASSALNTAMLDCTVPVAPTVIGGSASWRKGPTASVSVDAPGTDISGSGVAGYESEITTDMTGAAGWGALTSGASRPFAVTGQWLTRFRTIDNAGNVSTWAPATATAPAATTRLDLVDPGTPTATGGSLAWQTTGSVNVTATAGTDADSGLAGYEHQTSVDNGVTWLPATPAAGGSVPVTAEGTTLVRFRSVDNAGRVSGWSATSAGSTVKIDRNPPTNPTATGGSFAWQKVASVDVTPTGSTDAGSGVADYEFRTSADGGATWTAPATVVGGKVTITAEADTIVQFRAVDATGFTSAWKPSPPIAGSTVRLDRTAPTAPTVAGGSSSWQDVASVTVTGNNPAASGGLSGSVTYVYRTRHDGGAWSLEETGPSVTVTDEGTTDVEFKSIDGAGNESAWTAGSAGSDTVRIDHTAPTVPIVTGGFGSAWKGIADSPVPVTGSSTDVNGSGGITYESRVSLNGGPVSAATPGATRPISTEGVSVVEFRAQDALGHWSAWSSATPGTGNRVSLDLTRPTAPALTGGSSFWRDDASVDFDLGSSTDAGGSTLTGRTYRTRLNGGTWSGWTAYTAPVTVSGEGLTEIEAKATDVAGNDSTPIAMATIKLDRLAPTDPTATGGNGGGACSAGLVTITRGASSDGVGSGIDFYEYRVSIDGGAFGPATTGIDVAFSPNGVQHTYVVQFRATDLGGHASAWAPFTAGPASTAFVCA